MRLGADKVETRSTATSSGRINTSQAKQQALLKLFLFFLNKRTPREQNIKDAAVCQTGGVLYFLKATYEYCLK